MQSGKLLATQSNHTYLLKLVGDVRLTLSCTLDELLDSVFKDPNIHAVVIDLSEADNLDSTTLGLLAKIAVKAAVAGLMQPSIISPKPDITHLLESMGFRDYFLILSHPLIRREDMEEVPQLAVSEEVIRQQVLEAHLTLMSMNEQNHQEFKSVVDALEASLTQN